MLVISPSSTHDRGGADANQKSSGLLIEINFMKPVHGFRGPFADLKTLSTV